MVRPRRFLRALVTRRGPATIGVALCLPLVLPLVHGLAADAAADSASAPAALSPSSRALTTASRAAAVPPEPDTAPLRVRIGSMSKSSLPAKGNLTVRGTITNRSDETWTTIKLYTFVGSELDPMTDPAELEAAMDVPYDAQVGERLYDVGEPGLVEVLEPGETASYVVKVPISEFDIPADDTPAEGVYWFGVHALGQGGSLPRDTVADGRARTFLPYVPRRTDPVPASLIVPLTHAVTFNSDGSIYDEDRWTQRLRPGGRLRDLLSFGLTGAATGVPITWLVDPALLDAIGRLAAGNLPRSLAPTPSRGTDEPTASGDPDPSEAADPDGESPTLDPDVAPDDGVTDTPAAQAARDWLAAADDAFGRGEVLTLPYGNPDIAAAQRVKPGLLDLALAQQSTVLASLGVESRPVFSTPGGYVDPAIAAAAPDETSILVSDRFLPSPAPGVARLDGHELIVTSSGAAHGSPGPGRAVTAVGLRQRVLAEAAVRAVPDQGEPASASGRPLLVMMPTAWNLDTAEEFFDGLEPDWISFGPLSAATSATPTVEISTSDLSGSEAQQRRELEPETFEAAQELIDTGDTLQRVLVENTRVGARITEQALSGLNYALRRQQRVARSSLALSRSWLDAKLASVQITASSGVTLSGDSGTFVVTLTNKLDEAVSVSIAAISDADLTVDPIEPLELGPDSRTSVLLKVTTATSRVHNVTLLVTDADGAPLGASDQLPIRSVLVSDVIWVIIGIGVGTLFLAIALRLRRRILAARRGGDPSPT
ncbi:DUF6049 family protein [soil metagenome]